jgi:hypothetical protein
VRKFKFGKRYGKTLNKEKIKATYGTIHCADMVQTYKIVTGKDMLKSEAWFKSVTVTGRATRSAADPLNLRPQA